MARELTHAELERNHYQEVKENPLYVAEGMMDIRLEEFSMNMPISPNGETGLNTERTTQEAWDKNQWHIVQQLQGEMANLKRKFLDLEKLVTSKGSKYGYY